ncbi:tRNA dihydrouridine(20/20a) synthase DusA [Paralimibaculum aggregatum]|uniref:tRNA-dihydrouridine(20/20a) synthase n=2 Tax=Paralimibaculum aggregatum TaxID=3036245 RepID=A0ABQ6LNL3_9RHOB|nr:tRNA dihydrouridine(20/20a) synthase DusA [Limibaculum sp. NKW23]GMG84753.1 tRNA dihydrouridine(20/20a) synthase DusA [Limibaculum sp. NKW23]
MSAPAPIPAGRPVPLARARRLSVAPMMEWTDRHCRMFHRQFSAHALLYTEMVTASGLVLGGADWLLAHDPREHPLALQLGGSEPEMLARAVEMALPFGFAEINLNVGCPSDRVQSGAFGACLMREPALVADCARAMIAAAGAAGPEITVKCRIGVDEQDPAQVLPDFVDTVAAAGVRVFAVHARKAWLKGLSPKENRSVPPLDYALVARLKASRPELTVLLNGGIASLAEAEAHCARFDGAMVGRAAYHDPAGILAGADALITGRTIAPVAPEDAVRGMLPHIEAELARGARLNQIARHMLGAFAGRPGARAWRRHLSEQATRPGAGPEVVEAALAHLAPVQAPVQAATQAAAE